MVGWPKRNGSYNKAPAKAAKVRSPPQSKRAGFDSQVPSSHGRPKSSADDGRALAGKMSEISSLQHGQMFKAH